MNADKKVLIIEGKEVEVTQEVYEAYWDGYNEMENLKRSDLRHQVMHYDADDTEDGLGVEKYIDELSNVEGAIEKAFQIETVKLAVASLNIEEQKIIHLLYTEEQSFRQISTLLGIDRRTVALKHKKILMKLEKILSEKIN